MLNLSVTSATPFYIFGGVLLKFSEQTRGISESEKPEFRINTTSENYHTTEQLLQSTSHKFHISKTCSLQIANFVWLITTLVGFLIYDFCLWNYVRQVGLSLARRNVRAVLGQGHFPALFMIYSNHFQRLCPAQIKHGGRVDHFRIG